MHTPTVSVASAFCPEVPDARYAVWLDGNRIGYYIDVEACVAAVAHHARMSFADAAELILEEQEKRLARAREQGLPCGVTERLVRECESVAWFGSMVR